ncbi:hypothetical protein GCM10027413_05930 [Conyzicola nivalis]|uniref:Uncharacterized protein n=1 Tax=Conyzicola nivalis TaxID=1477021 RepID=A0A916WKD3_9MICO|nr:hypothetical protein [Conyzicola nivalis]GGB05879.1 hypothetical protein GCM10010979_20700 [Conyzicola nivalis]
MPSHHLITAVQTVATNNDGLTWWLASVCALAFVLATGGAILLSAHQRRQRVPHPHYHRHSPTDVPPDE